ncbi:histone H2B-like [Rattus norvegicus]|uniref:histone H2B-like n=1 Tax=Rattus norvegicus TaxID=10116 RepID=UPI00191733FC|nr:histone H2B-like [Rattus norvegicus]
MPSAMASTSAVAVVEELSSDTSEELMQIRRSKKAKSKREKDRSKKEKPEDKKPKKEKPDLFQHQHIDEDEHRAALLIRCRKTSFLKVLKDIHVGFSLSKQSISILDSFVKDMFERIASEANFLARQTRSSTIDFREIQTAVHLLLPGELCQRAVAEGTMAMVPYISSK